MKMGFAVIAVGLALAAAAPVFAQHSLAVELDASRAARAL
jgi:Zn-dependent membrane protease YugP